MQGQYNHGVAYYRCRYAQEYAIANKIDHPTNVYLREDTVTDPLDTWLATAFNPTNLQRTIAAMAAAQPTNTADLQAERIHNVIARCDTKLGRYRAALDSGADPAVVTAWIAETQAERAHAEAELHTTTERRTRRLSDAEIERMVTALGDIAAVLRKADPTDKAEVY
jgi:site-specific DNA recombinase